MSELEDKVQFQVQTVELDVGEPVNLAAPGPGWFYQSAQVVDSGRTLHLVTLWKRVFCMNCGAYWHDCFRHAGCEQAVAE